LAQKIGPLGVPAKKVQDDIAKASLEYKGLRLRVKLTVANRIATVELQPSTACLIIKSLKEPARDRKKEKNIKHHGNLTMDQILDVARKTRVKSLARELKGTVLEVLGTCSSMGCNIEGNSARSMIAMIKAGEVEVPAK
jgi:large subunit ribosomal protein L12e